MSRNTNITGKETFFDEKEVIVTKTDTKGIITYANDVFLRVAGFAEEEIIGKPHNIIRHPEMPKGVFAFLWDRIKSGGEIFAYVNNLAKTGDNYWVLAHVTPTFAADGKIIGYHSSRRVPSRSAVSTINSIYKLMLDEEVKAATPKEAVKLSLNLLTDLLEKNKVTYDEFIFSL